MEDAVRELIERAWESQTPPVQWLPLLHQLVEAKGRVPGAWSTDICNVLLSMICTPQTPNTLLVDYLGHAIISGVVAPTTFLLTVAKKELPPLLQSPLRMGALVTLSSYAFTALESVDTAGMAASSSSSSTAVASSCGGAEVLPAKALMVGLLFVARALDGCVAQLLANPPLHALAPLADNVVSMCAAMEEVMDSSVARVNLMVAVHEDPGAWGELASEMQCVASALGGEGVAVSGGSAVPEHLRLAVRSINAGLAAIANPLRSALDAGRDSFLIGKAALEVEASTVSMFLRLRIAEHLSLSTLHSLDDRVAQLLVLADLAQVPSLEFLTSAVAAAFAEYSRVADGAQGQGRDLYFFAAFPLVLGAWQDRVGRTWPGGAAGFVTDVLRALRALWEGSEHSPGNDAELTRFIGSVTEAALHYLAVTDAQAQAMAGLIATVQSNPPPQALPWVSPEIGVGPLARRGSPVGAPALDVAAFAAGAGPGPASAAEVDGLVAGGLVSGETPAPTVSAALSRLLQVSVIRNPAVAPAIAGAIVALVQGMGQGAVSSAWAAPVLETLVAHYAFFHDVVFALCQGAAYLGGLLSAAAAAADDDSGGVDVHRVFSSALSLALAFHETYELQSSVRVMELVPESVRGSAFGVWVDRVVTDGVYGVSVVEPAAAEAAASTLYDIVYGSDSEATARAAVAALSPWTVVLGGPGMLRGVADSLACLGPGQAGVVDAAVARVGWLVGPAPAAGVEAVWSLASDPGMAVSGNFGVHARVLRQAMVGQTGAFKAGVSPRVVTSVRRMGELSTVMQRQEVAVVWESLCESAKAAPSRVVGNGDTSGGMLSAARRGAPEVSELGRLRWEASVCSLAEVAQRWVDGALVERGGRNWSETRGTGMAVPEHAAYLLHATVGARAAPVLLTAILPETVPRLQSRRNAIRLAQFTVRYLAYTFVGRAVEPGREHDALELFFEFVTEFLEVSSAAALPPLAYPLTVLALLYQHATIPHVLKLAPSQRLARSLRALGHEPMIVPLFDLADPNDRAAFASLQ